MAIPECGTPDALDVRIVQHLWAHVVSQDLSPVWCSDDRVNCQLHPYNPMGSRDGATGKQHSEPKVKDPLQDTPVQVVELSTTFVLRPPPHLADGKANTGSSGNCWSVGARLRPGRN